MFNIELCCVLVLTNLCYAKAKKLSYELLIRIPYSLEYSLGDLSIPHLQTRSGFLDRKAI